MAYIQAISYYHPKKCLTNEDITNLHPEWSADKISAKTGIYRRYISADNETSVDMAECAANNLFNEYNVDKKQIDCIILCTQSPDYFLPTSACILQHRLGIKEECVAFDYNMGCSGYVYGLGLAKGLIVSGQVKCVLLITSETYSKYIHPEDKSCKTIFGDAASASLITRDKCADGLNAEILESSYLTMGAQYRDLIVENGGSRNPNKGKEEVLLNDDGTYRSSSDYLFMDGKSIFEFSAKIVPYVVEQTLIKNRLHKEDINWYIFHQANMFMLNMARVRSSIPKEKFVIDLEDGGNTVSSTIPITIKRMISHIQKGDMMLLCGFGVGLSVAGLVLKIG
ncbi:MAG: ketoacyl-ACP synthase III [Paludibacteraceae bacterium]|nr:ketoacyl-ACP synthase III [Paludibacteraceae bacterium]